GISEEIFRRRQGRSESNARSCAVASEINGSAVRKRALNSRQKNRACGELLAIGSANPGRRAEQHRFIPEASECRRTIDPAKRIEVDSIVIVFQASAKDKCSSFAETDRRKV